MMMNIWVALAAVGFAFFARLIVLWQSGIAGTKLWEDMRQSLGRSLLYVNVLGMSLALGRWYPAAVALTHWLVGSVAVIEFGQGLALSGMHPPTGLLKLFQPASTTTTTTPATSTVTDQAKGTPTP